MNVRPSPHTLGRLGKTTCTRPSDARTRLPTSCAASEAANKALDAAANTMHRLIVTSPSEHVSEELHGLRIFRLSEPEHGPLADLDVSIMPRDVDQLVERIVVSSLRDDEGEMLAERE